MPANELQAVNQLLDTIGQQRVNSLSAVSGDAQLALNILRETSREVQSEGWQENRLRDITLTPDSQTGELILPNGVLRVEECVSEEPITLRGGKAFNQRENTTVFSDNVIATLIVALPFNDLTDPVRTLIAATAGMKFHRATIASQEVEGYTRSDVRTARILARQQDSQNVRRHWDTSSTGNYLRFHARHKKGISGGISEKRNPYHDWP